jgi:hypothetical protein
MDIKKIQEEVDKVSKSSFAKKSDKQLMAYEFLSEMYKDQNKGFQPSALIKFNNPENRKCKLTIDQVNEIRTKYYPHVYGKQRLAKEYGVSTSVIYRIIQGDSWK